jgi:hypothetical protein
MKNEINLIMSQKQTFIRKVLQESDLPEAWLARKISVSPQKLSYMLHKSKTIDADLYDRIIQVLSPYIQQTGLQGHSRNVSSQPILTRLIIFTHSGTHLQAG